MTQNVSPLDLRQAPFHLANKPLVVIDKVLDGFSRKYFSVASASCGQLAQLCLNVGVKVDFHIC
jgi:hypothetical protein